MRRAFQACTRFPVLQSHLQGRGREDRIRSGDRATHRHARMLTGHMHPRLPVRPGSPAYASARNIQTMTPGRSDAVPRSVSASFLEAKKLRCRLWCAPAGHARWTLRLLADQVVASRRIHDIVGHLTVQVIEALFRRLPDGGAVHIEDIQAHVELALMRDGHHKVARAYVLSGGAGAPARCQRRQRVEPSASPVLSVTRADGSKHPLDQERLTAVTEEACVGLADVSARRIPAGYHAQPV